MAGQVRFSVEGSVATVVLDNPGRRNAVSAAVFEDLGAILRDLAGDHTLRAVILTGAGSDFSVGADLAADPQLRVLRRQTMPEDVARLRTVSRMLEELHSMPQVTIAAIDGACAGAGFSLAMATDFRVAAESAVFNTAFVNAGLSGDLGGIWLVTRMLGGARARELFLHPRKVAAERALVLGLVTSVVPADQLAEATTRLAHQLAALPPLALRATKQNILQATTAPLGEYLHAEVDRIVQCAHSEDAKEAANAFLEKRPAVYTGR